MSVDIFNKRQKLAAPPFITIPVQDLERRRNILKTWSRLQQGCEMDEKSTTFSYEGKLLKAFIIRKGTQLRLEKALMLTRRILTLVVRWKSNAFWEDFGKFRDAFTSEDGKPLSKKKGKPEKQHSRKTERVKGNMKEIRLPSRQWSNWVIYLTLRDLLLLSKIKYECERTVGYWLGLISCSHHPADSLIIVGILSRLWVVSSGMVEDYANQIYPRLCDISTLLSTTKADNWLQDIDFPNDVFTWLEKILGFSFQPATVCGYEGMLSKSVSGRSGSSKMGKILKEVFGVSQEDKTTLHADLPTTSSRIRDPGSNIATGSNEEEDLGVPVNMQERNTQQTKKLGKKGKGKKGQLTKRTGTKPILNERWAKFFKNFKTKLETEGGRKQLLTRIKKYKKAEANFQIIIKLQKLLKFVKNDKPDKVILFLPKFKKFVSKTC